MVVPSKSYISSSITFMYGHKSFLLIVINFGKRIADGNPKKTMKSKEVREIYIGIEADA